MNKEYSPLSYSEARHYTDMTKKMPRDEVEFVQRLLQRRALEAGVCSPDVLEVISSITDRFFEEDREMRRKAIEEDLRKRGVMEQMHIDADDDHIVLAIKWTLPKYHSDWDWGGIYRILVDFCDFPVTKTDFVRRMARMGIYAQDNYVKNLDHTLPPAIRGQNGMNINSVIKQCRGALTLRGHLPTTHGRIATLQLAILLTALT